MKTKLSWLPLILLIIVTIATLITMVVCLVQISANIGNSGNNTGIQSGDNQIKVYKVSFVTGTETTLVDMNTAINMYYSLPTVQRKGYLFGGWYNGNNPVAMSGIWTLDSDVTLTAKWIVEGYSVGFSTNAQEKIETINLEYGAKYSLPQPMAIEGYSFEGWYNGNTAVDSHGTWTIMSDVVLVAKWTANVYTVSFDSTTEQLMSDIEIVYDTYYNLPQPQEQSGYTFIGWVDSEGESVVSSGVWKIAQDITLTAKWQANTYNVTLVGNNGQSDKHITVTYGESYQLNQIEKNGYIFDGWYNDIVYVPLTGEWDIAQDVILVAKWQPIAGTGGITYELMDNSYYSVSRYISSEKNVIIPAEYNGKPVRKIAKNAFNSRSINSVTIPSSVTEIEESAFADTTSLSQVNLSDGLIYIAGSAFKNSGVTKIVIPATVTQIAGNAFARTKLKDITILSPKITISEDAFYDVAATKVTAYGESFARVPSSSLEIANIIGGSLPTSLFWGVTSLKEVILNDGITSISDRAFSGCTGLTSVTLPNSIISLDSQAFYECNNLENIELSNKLESIGEQAFYGCSSLKNINLPNTLNSIGTSAFSGCSSLENISLPDNVRQISNSTFYNCTNLKNISYSNEITSIGSHAFYGCSSLQSINLPETITEIPSSTFYDCSSLANISLPSGLNTIESDAFSGCSSLKSISVPDTVTHLGSGCFRNCNNLISLEIPFVGQTETSSVYNYLPFLFGGGSTDSSMIPSSITTLKVSKGQLDKTQLKYVGSIKNVVIGKGVTAINPQAFDSNLILYYEGSQEEWSQLTTETFTQPVYFYSENNPFVGDGAVSEGNFWHYVDNIITIWTKTEQL